VDHATAQASLPDALHLRVKDGHSVEEGPPLFLGQRMYGHAGGLVGGQPALTPGKDT
jgi:hypothetical protein